MEHDLGGRQIRKCTDPFTRAWPLEGLYTKIYVNFYIDPLSDLIADSGATSSRDFGYVSSFKIPNII